MYNFVDINDTEQLKDTLTKYQTDTADIYSVLGSFDFSNNVCITPQGILAFAIQDDDVFIVNNDKIEDIGFFVSLIEQTKGNIKKQLTKIEADKLSTLDFSRSTIYMIHNELYTDNR